MRALLPGPGDRWKYPFTGEQTEIHISSSSQRRFFKHLLCVGCIDKGLDLSERVV